jgi:hypothetical protein
MGETMRNLPDDMERMIEEKSAETAKKIEAYRQKQQMAKAKKFEAHRPAAEAPESTKKPLKTRKRTAAPNKSEGEIFAEDQTSDTFEDVYQELVENDPKLPKAEREQTKKAMQAEKKRVQRVLQDKIDTAARLQRLKGYKEDAKRMVEEGRKRQERDFEQREREAAELLGTEGLAKIDSDIQEAERKEIELSKRRQLLEEAKKRRQEEKAQKDFAQREQDAAALLGEEGLENIRQEIEMNRRSEQRQDLEKTAQRIQKKEEERADFEDREVEAAVLLGEEGLENIRQEIEDIKQEGQETVIVSPEYQAEVAKSGAEQYEQLLARDQIEDIENLRRILAGEYGIRNIDEYARNLRTSTWAKAKHLARMLRPGFRNTWNKFSQAKDEYEAL